MNAASILTAIQDRIEALDPFDCATTGDRFRGHVGGEPPLNMDRTFSVGSSLPARATDFLSPTDYVVTVAIAVAYQDGDAALARILTDAEQIAETIYEMGSDLGVVIDQVPEGQIHQGPVANTLIAARMFRLRYTLG